MGQQNAKEQVVAVDRLPFSAESGARLSPGERVLHRWRLSATDEHLSHGSRPGLDIGQLQQLVPCRRKASAHSSMYRKIKPNVSNTRVTLGHKLDRGPDVMTYRARAGDRRIADPVGIGHAQADSGA